MNRLVVKDGANVLVHAWIEGHDACVPKTFGEPVGNLVDLELPDADEFVHRHRSRFVYLKPVETRSAEQDKEDRQAVGDQQITWDGSENRFHFGEVTSDGCGIAGVPWLLILSQTGGEIL